MFELVFDFIHTHIFNEIPTQALEEVVEVVEEILKVTQGEGQHFQIVRKVYLEALEKEKILRLKEVGA